MQVPFGPKPEARQRPPIDPTFLAMAAADLNDAGCLYEPPPSTTSPNANINPRDDYETWKGLGIENESVRLPPSEEG